MKSIAIDFELPAPWSGGKRFQTRQVGAVNFLVGPNGTGKSRFAASLRQHVPHCRLLGTDRLTALHKESGLGIWGSHFERGFPKRDFDQLKQASIKGGFGVDSFLLLEEKLDLRITIEATLSSLFDREITLEWDSGNLIPKASLKAGGNQYEITEDECHGIKEILVLLTHLYNDDAKYLIVDEPELHLHPQFQTFFMEEVRKLAGDPDADLGKKCVFLVTHSPFIVDMKGLDDLRSVICFDTRFNEPSHLYDLTDGEIEKIGSLVPRLNVHHKQPFFSDRPIFVEGILVT